MGVALATTGWWLYIDVPQTANAVVICVIIFNAAFGYRSVFILGGRASFSPMYLPQLGSIALVVPTRSWSLS